MLGVLLAYFATGLVFAVWFVTRGAALLDAAAGASGWAFRCIIVPGAVALWPYLLFRLARKHP